jgi:hypothetical protein
MSTRRRLFTRGGGEFGGVRWPDPGWWRLVTGWAPAAPAGAAPAAGRRVRGNAAGMTTTRKDARQEGHEGAKVTTSATESAGVPAAAEPPGCCCGSVRLRWRLNPVDAPRHLTGRRCLSRRTRGAGFCGSACQIMAMIRSARIAWRRGRPASRRHRHDDCNRWARPDVGGYCGGHPVPSMLEVPRRL